MTVRKSSVAGSHAVSDLTALQAETAYNPVVHRSDKSPTSGGEAFVAQAIDIPEGAGRMMLLSDIAGKWGKLSEGDLNGLSAREDLVALIMARYDLDHGQAQFDADNVLKGRQF